MSVKKIAVYRTVQTKDNHLNNLKPLCSCHSIVVRSMNHSYFIANVFRGIVLRSFSTYF